MQSSFEEELKRDGFADVETKSAQSNKHAAAHAHPFDVRAKVCSRAISR